MNIVIECLNRHNNLIKHQSTAKYCIALQNSPFECEYCLSRISTKQKLKYHYLGCIEYNVALKTKEKDFMIKILQEQNKKLEDKLERLTNRIADNPTHQTTHKTTNILNNMVPLSQEHFAKFTEHLDLGYINQGAEGYAQYALDHPLKNNIHYADKARHVLKYKNSDGVVCNRDYWYTLNESHFIGN